MRVLFGYLTSSRLLRPGAHTRAATGLRTETVRARPASPPIEWAQLWVVFSAFLVGTGWVLSALGALTRAGYLAAFALGAGALVVAWKRGPTTAFRFSPLRWRRFRRPLPLLFLTLAVLSFLGGALYAPTNYDALSYRIPRVLSWLTEGCWHWIHVSDQRFNDRACGFEWLTAPALLFLRTDRVLFLINWVSYLLLPALVFQVLSGLGVRRQVAWRWMWLLPSGYCFLLQAGSISNDAFATIYLLAAMRFALAARYGAPTSPGLECYKTTGQSGHAASPKPTEVGAPGLVSPGAIRRCSGPGAVWLALLAAALLTGAKGTNLPLLLPIGVALWPALPLLLRRPAGSLLALALAALVSFLPTAILNIKHCGDWSGVKLENPVFVMSNPVMGVVGNAVQVGAQNLVPPFFPWAQAYNENQASVWPEWIVQLFARYFEPGSLKLLELPNEEGAAVGFGITVLALLSAAGAALYRWREVSPNQTFAHCAPGPGRDAFHRVPLSSGDWGRGGTRPYRLSREVHGERGQHWRPVVAPATAPSLHRRLLLAAPYVALLAYAAKSGLSCAGRLIAPYYPLLLALPLQGYAQTFIVRQRWWKLAAGLVLVLALGIVILTPARPLWPALTVTRAMRAWRTNNALLARAERVYAVYAGRSDVFGPIRALVPPGEAVVGIVSRTDDPVATLWKPFGQRRLVYVVPGDSPAELRRRGVRYVVLSPEAVSNLFHMSPRQWADEFDADLVGAAEIRRKAALGPETWSVAKLPEGSPAPGPNQCR